LIRKKVPCYTGDTGRWLADGNIEFLGRNDAQVKIRGYRIELGEIESLLLQHEAVKEAAVIAFGEKDHKELAAYFVSDRSELNAGILRNRLKQTLPDYMIPSYFVQLESLPHTPGGKIDRKSLPAPDRGRMRSETAYIAPRNEIESRLADLWQEVLNIRNIGVRDNFFEIGGHSLKALTLTGRIRKAFGIDIQLSEIYRKNTIEEQAHSLILCRKLHSAEFQGRCGYFLNFNLLGERRQGKIIFCFPPLPGTLTAFSQLADLTDCCCLYAFDFIRNEDRIRSYTEAVQSLQPRGPYTLLGYSAGGNLAFHVAGELAKQGEKVSDLILLDSMRRKEKPGFDEQEVFEEVTLFLSRPESGFSGDEKTKQLILDYVTAYQRYFSSTADEGMFEGNIHLIVSENSGADMISGWQEVAAGSLRAYQGKGPHALMLTGENVKNNARILRDIIGEG